MADMRLPAHCSRGQAKGATLLQTACLVVDQLYYIPLVSNRVFRSSFEPRLEQTRSPDRTLHERLLIEYLMQSRSLQDHLLQSHVQILNVPTFFFGKLSPRNFYNRH
jgi:hypothetical protein